MPSFFGRSSIISENQKQKNPIFWKEINTDSSPLFFMHHKKFVESFLPFSRKSYLSFLRGCFLHICEMPNCGFFYFFGIDRKIKTFSCETGLLQEIVYLFSRPLKAAKFRYQGQNNRSLEESNFFLRKENKNLLWSFLVHDASAKLGHLARKKGKKKILFSLPSTYSAHAKKRG